MLLPFIAAALAAGSSGSSRSKGCTDTTHLWIPKSDSVPLWRTKDSLDRRGPSHLAARHELLLVVECDKKWMRVVAKDGAKHWVPISKIEPFKSTAMASMDLGASRMEGYLDNPQAVYILQEDGAGMPLPPESIDLAPKEFGTAKWDSEDSKAAGSATRAAPASPKTPKSSGLRAGTTDDNQQFGAFLDFLDKRAGTIAHVNTEIVDRFRIRLVDSKGRGIPDASIQFSSRLDPRWDKPQASIPRHTFYMGGSLAPQLVTTMGMSSRSRKSTAGLKIGDILENGRTLANGTYWLYPSLWNPTSLFASMSISGLKDTTFLFDRNGPREIEIRVPDSLRRAKDMPVDLVFVMDATSSMSNEIERLKNAISILEMNLTSMPSRPKLRFGLVQFRDTVDDFRVRKIPFTSDADSFSRSLENVDAGGGGDTPEDLQSALDTLVHGMGWSERGIRLAFVITDAPPHLDYGQTFTYGDAAHLARRNGIKIHTLGVGGLSLQGEIAMRQIAQATGGKYVFLTYGERGESDGGHETSVSHHTGDNWVSERLETALLRLARDEIAQISEVPPVDSSGWFEARQASDDSREAVLADLFRQATQELVDYSSMALGDSQAVAVLPTVAEFDTLKTVAGILEQNLTLSVSRSGKFKLVDRGNLGTVLRELALQQSGAIDGSKVSETGKLLGAKYLLASGVLRRADRYELFLKLLRVETGEVLSATRARIDRKLVD